MISSASFASVTAQSSAVATRPVSAPITGPVSVLLSQDPQDAREVGIVEAHGTQPVELESLLAEFRARVASLGGDVARIDSFATRYEIVSELYTYDCSMFESHTEMQTVSHTGADGTTTYTTESQLVTEFVSKTCSEVRSHEEATLTLTGRAFRTERGHR